MGTAAERSSARLLHQRRAHCACAFEGIGCTLSWRFDFEEHQDFHWMCSSSWLRWSEARRCLSCLIRISSQRRSLSVKQKAPRTQTIRERLHNAHFGGQLGHLAPIGPLFNPEEKEKSARIWANPLSLMLSLLLLPGRRMWVQAFGPPTK